MINYLVKIKDGPFANRLGILKEHNNCGKYCIFFNLKIGNIWFSRDKIEFICVEPVSNNFYINGFCYWCDEKLKYYSREIKGRYYFTYYCPKCLR